MDLIEDQTIRPAGRRGGVGIGQSVDAFFIIVGPEVGNFEVGREAEFVVVDPGSTALMTNRMENVKDRTEEFFVFLVLGDDRAVAATYVMGDCLYRAS